MVLQRARLDEIDLVRGAAILGVLLVHATAWATVHMLDSRLFGVYNFVNIFFKFGTTTFLFLSSFVLFYNYYPQKLTFHRLWKFYRNRLQFVLVPYLLFSALYFVFKRKLENGSWDLAPMLADFGRRLLMGDAFYHLYFVFVNVQFYILFPFLLLLFQRFKRLAAHAFWIGMAAQWGFFIGNSLVFQVPERGSWVLSYFSCLMLGAWLGMHFDRTKDWLHAAGQKAALLRAAGVTLLWTLWLGFGCLHAALWHGLRQGGNMYPALLLDAVWNVHTLLTALVLMQLAFALNWRRFVFLTKPLRSLGAVSFGVYLLHPFILSVYERFPIESGRIGLQHIGYAGGFLITLTLSWGLTAFITRRIPGSWIAFGRVHSPARLQNSKQGNPQKVYSA